MEETIYLTDNMVICSRAVAPYLEMDFVRDNVWVIDEVIHESRNSARTEVIQRLQHRVATKDLEILKNIGDRCVNKYKILKLYEGCADALLLATALAINESEDGQTQLLFNKIPIIVTEERGIRLACDDLGIKWISQINFISLLKALNTQTLPLEL